MEDQERTENRIGGSALQPSRTYNRINHTHFYAAVPAPYKQYYEQFVRNWFEWYDGYVHWFHQPSNEGIFSTRLAYTVAHKLAKHIAGGRTLFDDGGETHESVIKADDGRELSPLEYTKKWWEENRGNGKIVQALSWALAGGDSVLKLDQEHGEATLGVVRKDNYFLDTDVFGNVTKFTTLIYHMVRKNVSEKGQDEHYYIMEERRYNEETGKPEWRFTIKKGEAHGVSYKSVSFHSGDMNFRDLTKGKRDELKRLFPYMKPNDWGKWLELPFKDLGIYLLKASERVSFQPSLPFGESIFSGAIHLLMSYDFYYSAKNTDMYIGRGRVLLPRGMENPNHSQYSAYGELERLFYEKVSYANPEDQTPTPVQFDLRADSWTEIRDNLLQELAMVVGVNPRTIGSFVVPSAEKPTAHEISTDEHETAIFVEEKRDLNEPQLNKLLVAMLDYYGCEDKVFIKFSRKGLQNPNTIVNHLASLKQYDMIDTKTALEMYFPDKTEKQIAQMLKRIEEEKGNKQQQAPPSRGQNMDTRNDPLEREEQGYNRSPAHTEAPNDENEG